MSESRTIAVSVITPVYKTPLNYFRECLDSLHNQTMLNAEFIIVFDGEDHQLLTFCEDYKKKDSRFKLYIQPHVGVSATRNFGIKQATGEYITFVDADDRIDRKCCQDTYDYAKKNNSDIVLFDYAPISNQYQEKYFSNNSISLLSSLEIKYLLEQVIRLTDEKNVAAVSTWCKLINQSVIKENNLSFPTEAQIAVDRPFSFSLYLHAKRASYLHKKLYYYNKIDSSITYKFYNNKYPLLMAYLTEIKKKSTSHNEIIANQAIEMFFNSWIECYFNKKNTDSLAQRVKNISNIIKSNDFQALISNVNYKGLPFLVKIDTFFIKRKISIHVWLHAIKWKLFS